MTFLSDYTLLDFLHVEGDILLAWVRISGAFNPSLTSGFSARVWGLHPSRYIGTPVRSMGGDIREDDRNQCPLRVGHFESNCGELAQRYGKGRGVGVEAEAAVK